MVEPLAVTDTLSTGVGTTVTLQVADTPDASLAIALMSASPTATAVILPLASTVATAVFDEVHVSDLSEASAGAIVAVSWAVSVALS